VTEYAIFLHGLAQQWRLRKKRNLAQRQPRGWGWCLNFEYTHSTETACDTTLDDGNASQHVTSISVTALCNQPEAFASDLVDDQSCYLFA